MYLDVDVTKWCELEINWFDFGCFLESVLSILMKNSRKRHSTSSSSENVVVTWWFGCCCFGKLV